MKEMNKAVYLRISILCITKTLMYAFGMIMWSQSIRIMQKSARWILTALWFILKFKIFIKIFLLMLNNGLTHQTTTKMKKDHFQ